MDKALLERTVGTIVSNYPQVIPHLSGDVFAVMCKHYGPGEHPGTGTDQDVHGEGGGGESEGSSSSVRGAADKYGVSLEYATHTEVTANGDLSTAYYDKERGIVFIDKTFAETASPKQIEGVIAHESSR